MSEYAADEFRRIHTKGPYTGEDFHRVQVTGDGSTNWVNITPDELELIIAVVGTPPLAELIRNVVLYNWVEEHEDYEQQDEDGQRNHIFLTLVQLAPLAGLKVGDIDAEIARRVQEAIEKLRDV